MGLDLAVANYDTDNVSIWLNNGQGVIHHACSGSRW